MHHASKTIAVSALALMLAAPHAAEAKAGHVAATPKISAPTAKAVTKAATPKMINTTKTGYFDNTTLGSGTYARTVTGTGNDKTITTIRTLADGTKLDTQQTVLTTKNSDGSTTRDVTTTGSNGNTTIRDITQSASGTAGDYSLSGTVTQVNGKVDDVSGTRDTVSGGSDADMTYTNGHGKTKTLNDETLHSGDATANIVTGTGFGGNAISSASISTNSNLQAGQNTVASTANGAGTYSYSAGSTAGSTSLGSTRTFGNGVTGSTSSVITPNGNGTTTVASQNTTTSTSGTTDTGSTNLTYSSTSTPHDNTVAGTFTNSNGNSGTISGTAVGTNYGYDSNSTWTNQNGAIKTGETKSLTAGDAVLNVSTSTGFGGQMASNSSLTTGQAAGYFLINHPESGQ